MPERARARFLALGIVLAAGLAAAQPAAEEARLQENKRIILSRMRRDPVAYRGDKPGDIRVRWEWWDKVINRYVYEKSALLREMSIGEKYVLREQWAFKDMQVTFQEVFQLPPEDDDKLVPIISHEGLLSLVPAASFSGVTLLGKHGDVKGPFRRKYRERVANAYGAWIHTRLEYTNEKGAPTMARGMAFDAITVRWGDIKNRTLDDLSEAKTREDAEMDRDAQYPEDAGARD
jgi:hypothetical protein